MNAVADILGISLPTLKAQYTVTSPITNAYRKKSFSLLSSSSSEEQEDHCCQLPKQENKDAWKGSISFVKDDDDDTASTVSTSEEEEFDDSSDESSCFLSSSPSSYNVSFPEHVVTDIRYRPKTTQEEKHLLFYQGHEYAEMRYEARTGRRRSRRSNRRRVVQFVDTIVTDVHEIPSINDLPDVSTKDLFYSESDVQKFLDEFLSSLAQ